MRTTKRVALGAAALGLSAAAALAGAGDASADTEYRVPGTNSINLSPADEATATYVLAPVINGSTQHAISKAFIGDQVTTNTGTQYYLYGGAVRIQYWDGSKYVSFGGWDFGDCGYACYGWRTPVNTASTGYRAGAVYAAYSLDTSGGHTSGRYKL